MSEVYAIGVGQVRFGTYPRETEQALAAHAVNLALLDSGLDRAEVPLQLVAAGEVSGPGGGEPFAGLGGVAEQTQGEHVLHQLWQRVQRGEIEVGMAVGAGRSSPGEGPTPVRQLCNPLRSQWRAQASLALGHLTRQGVTREQLAQIAVKNHRHGSLNPRAACQRPVTLEEVLAGRVEVFPFTRAMCAREVDGAAAVILCSAAYLKRLGTTCRIRLRASTVVAATEGQGDSAVCAKVFEPVWDLSGLDPAAVHLAEVDDQTAFAELWHTEALGFCSRDAGGLLAQSGATRVGGSIPVNTSGGHESRGWARRASGLAQIHELVTQLREEAGRRQVPGARVGLALHRERDGSAAAIHVLERT